jgi:hypothetical protein
VCVTVDEFIARWEQSGGGERANTQSFINELCDLIEVGRPDTTKANIAANDYVFERRVDKVELDGATSRGWIDCYKRDCFILEAKQGSDSDRKAVDEGAAEDSALRDFYGQTAKDRYVRGTARRGTAQWTGAMQRAAGQAEGYAKALPDDWPPFLLVSDIGHCIDVYADFQRSGKGYAPFPDRKRFRIMLEDLRDEQVRERLKAIWTRPMSLDPSAEAARVTRQIADLLARLAKDIEAREQNPDRVAAFLMRLLFTMFAEDTGLIPKASFSAMLAKVRDRPENLPPMLADLWAKMDRGGFVAALGEAGETVRKFNGYLFKETVALPLTSGEIDVLIAAAKSDWRQVEPAIFGTLLERALDPRERAKLGAHYTPRAYVERLVGPTIMEPLREDWMGARTAATEAAEAGDKAGARKLVEAFHGKLARTRVLDPACGTGNFLYVAMARMKELEGEVLELLEELGDDQYLAEISGHTITPENFLGIEINPRAAEIAQLVLWIGYLQWHFRVVGEERMPPEPVLRDVRTIECRDALIEWDRKELERDQYGKPVTRWDGETTKKHPVTGKDVPDETARMEVYRFINPKAAKWPRADFIVGNPPFIGSNSVRERLGDGYFSALFRTTEVPESADYVMHWWDRAATIVRKNRARRFGFVTTNSILQTFSRRTVSKHLGSLDPLSLILAIPDHPWVSERGDAAVRIAMTVGELGRRDGRLLTVADESHAPDQVDFDLRHGQINADLSIGANLSSVATLKSNSGLSFRGVLVVGEGFRISSPDERRLVHSEPTVRRYLRTLVCGRDLTDRRRGLQVLDFFGLSQDGLQTQYPAAHSYLVDHVLPERQQNNRKAYRDLWWIFAEPRPEFRKATADIDRYIATPRTAKHRFFVFLENAALPESEVVAIASNDAYVIGILSSRIHSVWALESGGTLEDRPRYNNSRCFEPFPFPDTSDEALKARIRDSAEKLDALRKEVLARHSDLTLTKLYNVLDALRVAEAAGMVLSDKDRDVAERGCVSLIRQYHDAIDVAVAEAYGWGDLIVEGKSSPSTSSGRTVWMAGADEIILERLVALNKVRAAEEARGIVRWLRPDYQQAGYVAPVVQKSLDLPEEAKAGADILPWPAALPEQVVAVAGVVERAGRPIDAGAVARAFKGKRAASVTPVLDALAGMGRVRKLEGGRYAA